MTAHTTHPVVVLTGNRTRDVSPLAGGCELAAGGGDDVSFKASCAGDAFQGRGGSGFHGPHEEYSGGQWDSGWCVYIYSLASPSTRDGGSGSDLLLSDLIKTTRFLPVVLTWEDSTQGRAQLSMGGGWRLLPNAFCHMP